MMIFICILVLRIRCTIQIQILNYGAQIMTHFPKTVLVLQKNKGKTKGSTHQATQRVQIWTHLNNNNTMYYYLVNLNIADLISMLVFDLSLYSVDLWRAEGRTNHMAGNTCLC